MFDNYKTNPYQIDLKLVQNINSKFQNKFLEEIISATRSLGSLLSKYLISNSKNKKI